MLTDDGSPFIILTPPHPAPGVLLKLPPAETQWGHVSQPRCVLTVVGQEDRAKAVVLKGQAPLLQVAVDSESFSTERGSAPL